MSPETRYAASGDISIAYQVAGEGPVDLVVIPGIVSHVESFHDLPGYSAFLSALARFSRVITFDKRGNGLSDRVHEAPSLEERMDDVRAVLDAVSSKEAVLLGVSEGAPLGILFSATYPERTRGLLLFGAFARLTNGLGFSAGLDPEDYDRVVETTVDRWGTGGPLISLFGLSPEGDPELQKRAARCERLSATPTMLRRLWAMNASIDVREALSRVQAPTMVLHRRDDGVVPARSGRFLAENIPGARLLELDGKPHFPFVGDFGPTVEVLAELTGAPAAPPSKASGEAYVALRPSQRGMESLLGDDAPPTEVGRFAIERLLGRGAMASVYLAVDQDLSRRVALKVVRSTHAHALRRFRQEALAVARLSHPNVVPIYELGLDATVPYLVMEFVAGGTLAELLDEPVPWERASRVVANTARGLGAAHALGIVHRDVKPANVLLVEPGGAVTKVADFGVAKLAYAVEPITRQGTLVGTVGYLAPEQARGETADARSDVFSLGVTWYRLLTAERPFDGTPAEMIAAASRRALPDPRAALGSIPAPVAELVKRFGALDPKDRPADGARAADEIEEALGRMGPP